MLISPLAWGVAMTDVRRVHGAPAGGRKVGIVRPYGDRLVTMSHHLTLQTFSILVSVRTTQAQSSDQGHGV